REWSSDVCSSDLDYIELIPKQTPNTMIRVTPSHFSSVLYLFKCMFIVTMFLDRILYIYTTFVHLLFRPTTLFIKTNDKIIRCFYEFLSVHSRCSSSFYLFYLNRKYHSNL